MSPVLWPEVELGTIEAGKRAGLAARQVREPAERCYWIGHNPLLSVVVDGQAIANT